ncbi:hypothetical protein EYF80_043073 [Liparis tanakae]|uniref:BAAT/Acyl-CoA thioester hydrolase C-terminal domain-containing protein n=1 Tax=Liparis tanakae TaxID=230148 RepID=A0A4Z2G1J1_9TELE|nr:hypothetical protein EYF80_043073 [Liparis tanakae]
MKPATGHGDLGPATGHGDLGPVTGHGDLGPVTGHVEMKPATGHGDFGSATGHGIIFIQRPYCPSSFHSMGGEPCGHAHAEIHLWKKIQEFFRAHLST